MDNMRTFAAARLLRLNLCQLNAMSDAELSEELRINQPKPSTMDFSKAITNKCADSIDIRHTWRTSSPMVRGVYPYVMNGLSATIKQVVL